MEPGNREQTVAGTGEEEINSSTEEDIHNQTIEECRFPQEVSAPAYALRTVDVPQGVIDGMTIRPETADDYAEIATVNRAAFGGDEEVRLVNLLRGRGEVIASLVAANNAGRVVGHILFSPATVVSGERRIQIASLAPMAVLPGHQRKGIGGMLVRRGLEACRTRNYGAVIVVGHPDYYPRFGFSAAARKTIRNPFAEGAAFMALELVPESLPANGEVVYPAAFGELS